jgi:hypothetical protein
MAAWGDQHCMFIWIGVEGGFFLGNPNSFLFKRRLDKKRENQNIRDCFAVSRPASGPELKDLHGYYVEQPCLNRLLPSAVEKRLLTDFQQERAAIILNALVMKICRIAFIQTMSSHLDR